MTWRRYDRPFYFNGIRSNEALLGSSTVNEQCFIRKEHKCGKMYGASKSCFIACPTDGDLEPILELMSEKLSKLGVEPIIAVRERAYGQDIFCTKICGKIIESRFCVVFLNDTAIGGAMAPNPNVYYEYGLMTSLRKHIIPLQQEDLTLAFNIQSYDTIKYNPKNVSTELERAIRDAVRLTEVKDTIKSTGEITDKVILRKMELAGFEEKDEHWFLSRAIDDTAFRGFGQHEKGYYAYLGKIDGEEDFKTYLDDMGVVIYRTEKKAKSLQEELDQLKKDREERRKEEEAPRSELSRLVMAFPAISTESLDEKIMDIEERQKLMATIYIAFVMTAGLDFSEFYKSATSMIEGQGRYHIVLTQDRKMEFGDICVEFTVSQH